ncbi:MAG: HD domain-containing protein, partial [Clostridia bacterium]|nr:HD domain-containing protein [Clostridia bacterium]
IALGHDLGHTPFGHAGERELQHCYRADFTHNAQSLRVVEKLEKLNLTVEVRDGILNHGWKMKTLTPEAAIIQYADRIAYINHDIDDAVRAGVLEESQLPESLLNVLGHTHSDRINTMVTSVINASEGGEIMMEPDVLRATLDLHELMFELVYRNPVAKGEEGKACELVRMLYEHYVAHPDKFPEEYAEIAAEEGVERAAADLISGMTDRYAVGVYRDFFIPESWGK